MLNLAGIVASAKLFARLSGLSRHPIRLMLETLIVTDIEEDTQSVSPNAK
jgi:hypothetical protein